MGLPSQDVSGVMFSDARLIPTDCAIQISINLWICFTSMKTSALFPASSCSSTDPILTFVSLWFTSVVALGLNRHSYWCTSFSLLICLSYPAMESLAVAYIHVFTLRMTLDSDHRANEPFVLRGKRQEDEQSV